MPVSLEKDQPEDKPPAENPRRVPAQLTAAAQTWAVVLGALILGAGVVAVFVVNRDWGPVSLILIGAVLLLSGLTGRLPYVKWGDKEVDYSAYEKVIQVLESAPEERSERLEELAEAVPARLAPEVRKLASEAELMGLVRASLPRHVAVSDGIGPGYMKSDAVLIDSVGKKVILVLKRGLAVPYECQILRNVIPDLKTVDAQVVGGLFVHTGFMAPVLKNLLEQHGWETMLVQKDWASPQSVESLREAIERAFTPRSGTEGEG